MIGTICDHLDLFLEAATRIYIASNPNRTIFDDRKFPLSKSLVCAEHGAEIILVC